MSYRLIIDPAARLVRKIDGTTVNQQGEVKLLSEIY
jgi:hypothetical protein